ncbi:hypothetical protein PAMP_024180 [Pampus punctatissimus]
METLTPTHPHTERHIMSELNCQFKEDGCPKVSPDSPTDRAIQSLEDRRATRTFHLPDIWGVQHRGSEHGQQDQGKEKSA